MKKIKLSKGQFALVDDEDFNYLNQFRWHAVLKPNGVYYACRGIWNRESKNGTTISMHRTIMDILNDKNITVDHIDHDGLNNQKSNLRLCTTKENSRHRRKSKRNTSGYIGVCSHRANGYHYWRARIELNGKKICLGFYKNKEEAALAYNEGAKKYFGEFAYLNKI